MDILQSAIAEYEDVLIGKRKAVAPYYFNYNSIGNMRLALQIMKYAFATYLNWSPDQLRDCLTIEIIERLKLQSLLKFLEFPPELDSTKDLFYIAWLLYPSTVHFSEKDLILRVYKNLLDKKIQKYPKEFFSGRDGLTRAQVCLRFMIEQYLPTKSIDELYEYFATQKSVRVMRQNKLLVVCNDLFDTPVEFLHKSLHREQQNVFLYRYYDFCWQRTVQKLQLAEQLAAAAKAGDFA